jgi:hypothetical protein
MLVAHNSNPAFAVKKPRNHQEVAQTFTTLAVNGLCCLRPTHTAGPPTTYNLTAIVPPNVSGAIG